MAGPSIALDPLTHAVRGDLADVRLADRVFAPHYAEAMGALVTSGTDLRSAKPADAEVLATLAAGASFEVLELAGRDAWGIAVAHGLVGYVDRRMLEVV